MNIYDTPLAGVHRLEMDLHEDTRGYFAESWSAQDFQQWGLETQVAQSGISYNTKKGTLRGMHFQISPHEHVKVIRVSRGSIFDVALDLRLKSKTFKKWYGLELSQRNHTLLYVPVGVAHGFQSLQDETEVSYQTSGPRHVESERGVRWDDPAFQIEWPLSISVMSQRDQQFPDFES